MAKQISRADSALISDTLKTTSLVVAEHFGKRHDDVLKRIRSLDVPKAYHARNFAEMVHEVQISGTTYVITDIGMRMLTPRELFRAQGFPDDYIIDRGADGKALSKTAQIRMCGNSVCPPLAEALVRANCEFLMKQREVA